MPPSIAVDVSRLVTGLRFPRPTGIERMELGYAEALGATGQGTVLTPIGPKVVDQAGRLTIAAAARRHWQEDDGDLERELSPIIAFLNGSKTEQGPADRRTAFPVGVVAALAKATFRPPRWALRRNTVYFHANFFRLERPGFFEWLKHRPDVRAVFTLYDLLPLQFPQFFRPGEDNLHRRRIETVSRRADRIIVAAQVIAEELIGHLRATGSRIPPIEVVSLPVAETFFGAERVEALAQAPDFFVVCGTIEPRKNHRLLLDVWARLVEGRGTAAPKLIIAGRRGWQNDAVLAQLDDLGALAAHIHEAPSLSSRTLAALFRASTGVLSPSIAEGFGLPVAEALAAGANVLAADMPIYRELWATDVTLLDPRDPGVWTEAIMAARRTELNGKGVRVMRWRDHVDRMERLLVGS